MNVRNKKNLLNDLETFSSINLGFFYLFISFALSSLTFIDNNAELTHRNNQISSTSSDPRLIDQPKISLCECEQSDDKHRNPSIVSSTLFSFPPLIYSNQIFVHCVSVLPFYLRYGLIFQA